MDAWRRPNLQWQLLLGKCRGYDSVVGKVLIRCSCSRHSKKAWLLVLVLYCEYLLVYYDPIKLTQLLALVSWSRSRSLSLNHSISFIPLLRVVSLTASGDGAWMSMARARRDSEKNFYSSLAILLQWTMGSLHRFGYREDPEITPILLKLHVFFPIGEILQEIILPP